MNQRLIITILCMVVYCIASHALARPTTSEEFWYEDTVPAQAIEPTKAPALSKSPLSAGQRIILTPFRFSSTLQKHFEGANLLSIEQRFTAYLGALLNNQGFTLETVSPLQSDVQLNLPQQPKTGQFRSATGAILGPSLRPPAIKPLKRGSSKNASLKAATATISGEVTSLAPPQQLPATNPQRIAYSGDLTVTLTVFQESFGQKSFFIKHNINATATVQASAGLAPESLIALKQKVLEEALTRAASEISGYIAKQTPLSEKTTKKVSPQKRPHKGKKKATSAKKKEARNKPR